MPVPAIPGALDIINQGLVGQTINDAYDNLITGRYETDNGPPIGYADYTGSKPAITGDTSGTISDSSESVAVDAWHDYVENEVSQVSDVTGGAVSGSNIGTFVYSLMEENPGTATAVVKAVVPVAIPVQAAIVASCQALGVSMDISSVATSVKDSFINAVKDTAGVIYDAASDTITAWKDSLGRILFPKSVLESVEDTITELEIGPEDVGGQVDYSSVDKSPLSNPNYSPTLYAFPGTIEIVDRNHPTWVDHLISDAACCIRQSGNNTSYYFFSRSQFTVRRDIYPTSWNSQAVTRNGITYYYASASSGYTANTSVYPFSLNVNSSGKGLWDTAYLIFNGTGWQGGEGFPEGTEESEAPSYTTSNIPTAGEVATSYDPDSGILGSEEVVPIQLTEDPYNSIGSTDDPTNPTDEDNPGVLNPPIPLPIPDTNVSNPDVPLTNPTVVDNAFIQELVNELAETLDPQPAQSSGLIPVPPMPGIIDPVTQESSYPSIVPATGSGLIHIYNPTPAEFVSFGNWLWVTYADATIDKIWNNPFDGIIGAHELYATPSTDGTDNIRSGFLVCPTTAALVRQRYTEIDCGTVIIPEFYGNYLDYSPYSQAYIYLPFIGINEVSIDDIAGHAVNIRYRVDAYNGSCIAMIFVAKDGYQNLCYQFAGNCAVEVPLAGGSQAAIKAGVMQAEAYARSSMIQAGANLFGGIGSALMGNLGGVLSSLGGIASAYGSAQAGMEAARVANKSSVQHSGQFGASHGAMGEKIPFIIIRNPIQVKVVNYNEDYGFPAHKRVIVGGCRGYLRVKEVNVISAHATDDEKLAIEIALKNGVYVS